MNDLKFSRRCKIHAHYCEKIQVQFEVKLYTPQRLFLPFQLLNEKKCLLCPSVLKTFFKYRFFKCIYLEENISEKCSRF